MTSKLPTSVARKLRRERTEAELRLWSSVRDRQLGGYKFVEQFPIGDHVADFACRRAKLVIELDGGQHRAELDSERTRALEAAGYRVIRFWNHDVLGNVNGVLEARLSELRLGGGE